ncbi:MAG: hypothetical protein IJI49_00115 [Bacilli bacterium]|nr:hypothetical protein [Bacilli bacterium]
MKKMNKYDSINNTLRDIYVSLKNGHYVERDIYQYLTRRDVPTADRFAILSSIHSGEINEKTDLFYKWIKKFKKKNNIDVFCSYNWSYFCQFVNGDVSYDCYKIYIPLDYEHIYEGANKIFNFLRKNNIQHCSKIGKNIRFDDIVIRVNSEEDCRKIIDFVNNDKYIREGAFSNNVFSFSDGIANMAYDGTTSYNSVVSSLIADYINTMYDIKANINTVNINTFINYIDSFIKNNTNYYNKLHNSVNARCEYSDDEFLLICNLIKGNLMGYDSNYYYNFMKNIKNNNIDKIINNSFSKDNSFLLYRNNYNNDSDFFIEDIILFLMKRYGKDGYEHVNNFLHGNYEELVVDQKLYDRFINSNINLKDYCSRVFVQNEKDCEDIINCMMMNCIIDSSKIRFADIALEEGVTSEEVALYNINDYIDNGIPNRITNSVNGARRLLNAMNNKDMIEFFKRIGVSDVYEYNERYNLSNEIREGRKR